MSEVLQIFNFFPVVNSVKSIFRLILLFASCEDCLRLNKCKRKIIFQQVGVAVLLLLSTRYTVCEKRQREKAYRYGNYVVVGIFLITVVNVFVAAFGGSAVAGVSIPST